MGVFTVDSSECVAAAFTLVDAVLPDGDADALVRQLGLGEQARDLGLGVRVGEIADEDELTTRTSGNVLHSVARLHLQSCLAHRALS